MTRSPAARLVAVALLGATVVTLTACLPVPRFSPLPEADVPRASPSPAASGISSVVAERDAFLRVQGFVDDDSSMTATTPAQRKFLADQETYFSDQGWPWTDSDAALSLSLAVDACETAILQAHSVDADLLRRHVATSPLYASIIPADATAGDRADYEAGSVETAAYGASYICPADGKKWLAAFTEVYGP